MTSEARQRLVRRLVRSLAFTLNARPLEGSELARSGRTLRHDGHVLHSALNNTAATGFLVQLLGTENVAAATEELEKSSLI